MITKKEAGTVNGKAVAQYTLENENGLAMTFYTYGGIIQSLLVKDRQGIARDVELGFDTLDEYVKAACYYGARSAATPTGSAGPNSLWTAGNIT